MHDAYLNTSDLKSNVNLMATISKVTSALYSKSLNHGIDVASDAQARYKLATAAMDGLKNQPNTETVKTRLNWLSQTISAFERTFSDCLE